MALIIIVDDDRHVRVSLENLLESVGYEAESVGSGEDLLAHARWRSADCLILDVKMRGMDGLQLLRRIRIEQDCPPIVFLTAHSDEETRRRAIEGGARAFFAKPFEEDALLEAIAGAVAEPRDREGG
ncbi:response regulator transcription factor [Sphingomonas xinjiangensis]|uniref:FixJ family two-component response regulator n=1 Tax=Sphingomonas xinjiangensis TaxID=643568 RepID=A0A840YS28_9SPHN|nr:response regulator [Sphingomonas xinjiangensis]MBB5712473.1 FixJ family two-component response regulator [Sphingomonas xinjiangensis]